MIVLHLPLTVSGGAYFQQHILGNRPKLAQAPIQCEMRTLGKVFALRFKLGITHLNQKPAINGIVKVFGCYAKFFK